MDPAAWVLERQSRQLKRKLETLRASDYGSGWFEEWYAGKKAKKLHEPTLLAYLNDLVFFQHDPAKLTTSQIIQRLADISMQTNSGERYRRICVTIKTIVKRLHGRDEADKIPIPQHGKPLAWSRI